MKYWILATFLANSAFGMESARGWCEQGSKVVVAPQTSGGSPVTRRFQQSYPSCTVRVFLAGTGTNATIYSDNSSTPLTNPFTATNLGYFVFYAVNGRYDVQISGGGLASPFTFGGISLFDFLSQSSLTLNQSFAGGTAGGYIQLSPITYPNSSCLDLYGNPVNIPTPPAGYPAFSATDSILWVSESPMNGVGGCATQLPNNNLFGLNTSSYIFAVGGFGTANKQFNAINALQGGVTAGSFTAGTLYPTGTVTTTGTLGAPTYLGGYVQTGHSIGPPQAGTIATVTNPLTQFDGVNAGTIYWDDTLACEEVYNGTAWVCIGAGSSVPATPTTSIQFNGGGSPNVFAGSANLVWDNTNRLLTVTALDAAHPSIIAATGFMQADNGFLATSASAKNFNVIQAPGGGMEALSFSAVNYVQTGHLANPPCFGGGCSSNPITPNDALHQGAMFWNDTAACEQVYNGTAWNCIGSGGGGGAVGPTNGNIQFFTAGSFNANNNLNWSGTQLTVVGTVSATVGLISTGSASNTIQAPTGGLSGKLLTTSDSLFFLEEAAPAVSAAGQGRIYDDSTTHRPRISMNGAAYTSLATTTGTLTNGDCVSINSVGDFIDAGAACSGAGGGGTVTSSTATNVAYYKPTGTVVVGDNAFQWSDVTKILTLTGSGASVPANSGVAANVFNATNTGANIAFQTSNTNYQVDGNGNISTNAALHSNVSGSPRILWQAAGPQVDASNLATSFNFNGSASVNGNFVFNPGNVTGNSSVQINGHNNSSQTTQTLILNEVTGLGGGITMKHGGTFDAAWQAGASAAFDVVDNANAHAFVVLQNGITLVNRTTDDGSGAILQANGGISVAGVSQFNGHLYSSSTAVPTASCSGAGVTVAGSDTRGTISINTGTCASTISLTFASAYTFIPTCVISSGVGPVTISLHPVPTTSGMTIVSSASMPALTNVYYFCMQ